MHGPNHTGNGPNGEVMAPSNGRPQADQVVYAEALELSRSREAEVKGAFDYWTLLRRHKLLVLVILAGGVLGGAVMTMRQVPVYRARTTLEIQTNNQVSVRSGIEGIEKDSPSESALESYLQTQVVILESRSFRQRVAMKMAAKTPNPRYRTGNLSAWQGGLEIEVRVVPNTRIIEILTDSPDPEFSSDFANGMANEFLNYNLESRWNASQRTMDWLTGQLESFKKSLKDSEDRLQAYTRQAGLTFNEKGSVDQDKLRQVQEEYSRAQADRIARQSSFEMSRLSSPESVPEIADNARLSQYYARIADLRRELAELGAQFTSEHPRVKRVQVQLDQMQATLETERGSVLTRIQNEYQAALQREKLLGAAYSAQLGLVSDQAGKMVNYSLLKREVDTNRNLFDTLLGKMKEAGIAAAASASDSRIVDAAFAPSKPYKPNLYLNIGVAFALAFALSLGIVLVEERMDRTLKAPGEISYHLALTELGVIPRKDLARRDSRLALRNNAGQAGSGLATWQDEPLIVAESFRNIVASLRLSQYAGNSARVMLVTSPRRGDGKSSTVANLGITVAEINRRVLVIDADMRQPRLNKIFGVPNTWGLSDLLQEKNLVADMPIETLVRQTEMNGLHILPSGPGPASISSLLYSKRLMQLLQRFRAEYDVVLIDTPPMLAMSDARVLAQLADDTILVVRAKQTTVEMVLAAKQRLLQDGIPLLGTILVAWDGKARTRYSQEDYTAYYG